MQLSIRATAGALAVIWGAMVLLAGIVHLLVPGYGGLFLDMVASVYPGFHGGVSIGDLLIGTLYALIDGAISGAVFAWLYNLCLGRCAR